MSDLRSDQVGSALSADGVRPESAPETLGAPENAVKAGGWKQAPRAQQRRRFRAMMMPSMLRWFAPPDLLRPEPRRRARALWLMSWPFLAIVASVLAVAVVVDPATIWRRAITVTAVA